MVKTKKTEILPRPTPPSTEEIVADVSRATNDDPVFSSLEYIFTGAVKNNDEDLNLMQTPTDAQKQYVKVCDLMDMLSTLRNGKDQLENLSHQLMSSKEDVSAVALQLKTRLEKHKLISIRPTET